MNNRPWAAKVDEHAFSKPADYPVLASAAQHLIVQENSS
jgi:hypothetical protein